MGDFGLTRATGCYIHWKYGQYSRLHIYNKFMPIGHEANNERLVKSSYIMYEYKASYGEILTIALTLLKHSSIIII